MDTIMAVGVGLALLVVSVSAYTIGRAAGRAESPGRRDNAEEIRLSRTIHELQAKMEDLDETNTRYLSFMFNVSSIVERLNMTLSSEEIMSSVERLVKGVIDTDRVELYLFDREENRLKIAHSPGDTGEVSFGVGEGLVGMAARDGTVKVRGRDTKSVLTPTGDAHDASLFAAAPIHFRDRLFGVIGIGRVRDPMGNEDSLMKVIAGMALLNRSLLGHAKREAKSSGRNRVLMHKPVYFT